MPYVEYDEVHSTCSDCGRLFPSEESLADHRRESHAGSEPARGAPPRREFECSVCHQRFRSTVNLTEHNRRAHMG